MKHYGRYCRQGPRWLWRAYTLLGTRKRRLYGYWTRGQLRRASREALELAALFEDEGGVPRQAWEIADGYINTIEM